MFGLLEHHQVFAHLTACTERVATSPLELLNGSGRHARLPSPQQWLRINGCASERRVVFFAILAVARTVIWTIRKKRLYDDVNFSHRDLILFFRHQLRFKIRCDRKSLDCITFNKRCVYTATLVARKGATLESSFPPLPAHGGAGLGPSGPYLR